MSLLIACWISLVACQPVSSPSGFTVKVLRVLSGQMLEVVGVEGNPEITEQVRLEGILVPSLEQFPWGEAARAALAQWIEQQTVLLEPDVELRDGQGHRFAYLWYHGQLLNEKLVTEGYAIARAHSPNHKYDQQLANAQDRARILGLGIWNPSNPLKQEPDPG